MSTGLPVLLILASAGYGAAVIAHWAAWVRLPEGETGTSPIPTAIGFAGWVAHTLVWATQLSAANQGIPPWNDFHFSAVFLSWAWVTLQWLTELRTGLRFSAIPTLAGTIVVLVAASWIPTPGLVPLPPELISPLVWVHPTFATVAFALAGWAASVAMLHTICAGVATDRLLMLSALTAAGVLAGGIGWRPLEEGALMLGGHLIPGGRVVGGATMSLFGLHVVLGILTGGEVDPRKLVAFGTTTEQVTRLNAARRGIFLAATFFLWILLLLTAIAARKAGGWAELHAPVKIGSWIGLAVLTTFSVSLIRWRVRLEDSLPPIDHFERWVYSGAVWSFVALSFTLASGVLWAQLVWARPWVWDPKETWTFGAWVALGAYVHARQTESWRPVQLSALVIFAFVLLLAAIFGVNLWVPSRHFFGAV